MEIHWYDGKEIVCNGMLLEECLKPDLEIDWDNIPAAGMNMPELYDTFWHILVKFVTCEECKKIATKRLS